MYAQTSMKGMNTALKADPAALLFCRDLGAAAGNVVSIASQQKKASGEILFGEGDDADSVYEVVSGMMRLYKLMPDGRRQITGFVTSGKLVGNPADLMRPYTAEAVTDVVVRRYPRAAFDRLIDQVPGFARRLLSVANDELRMAQDQMLLLGRKTATEKVASFLLRMADDLGGEEMDVPMGRNDIADHLGLTIETVCRTLTRLKREGIIALPTPGHIEILDRDELEDLAMGGSDADV